MEPAQTKVGDTIDNAARVRHRLILGKFQVIKVEPGLTGMRLHINLGNSVVVVIDSPVNSDVQVGDRLTLYTEVLAHAQPEPTSIQ